MVKIIVKKYLFYLFLLISLMVFPSVGKCEDTYISTSDRKEILYIDRSGITHPDISITGPEFNIYTDAIYIFVNFDERKFALISKGDLSETGDSLSVDPKTREYILIHLYFNNAGLSPAMNVRVYTDIFYRNIDGNYVTTPFTNSIEIKNYIRANNTVTNVISDTTTVISKNNNYLRLRFIPSGNSSMWVRCLAIGDYNIIKNQLDYFKPAIGVSVGSKDAPLSGSFQAGDDQKGDDQRVQLQYYLLVERAYTDLSVIKSINKKNITRGQKVKITLNYANNGSMESTSTKIIDDYNEKYLDVKDSTLPSNCFDDGDKIICSIVGEFDDSNNGTINYTMIGLSKGMAVDTAVISSDMGENNPSDNSSTTTITVF